MSESSNYCIKGEKCVQRHEQWSSGFSSKVPNKEIEMSKASFTSFVAFFWLHDFHALLSSILCGICFIHTIFNMHFFLQLFISYRVDSSRKKTQYQQHAAFQKNTRTETKIPLKVKKNTTNKKALFVVHFIFHCWLSANIWQH